ncbi:uncharacterized protein RAG0_00075 [Rhynchosporium agropyri]|uniref:Uncharacterized protein n=1 Tax=Rhynchosporium agropyri TaxID=914238 RepID=A0A1E1JRR0_9HELO|nr:uncharacterized protein RAG0_00075 [Rhynchosporium agropyri]
MWKRLNNPKGPKGVRPSPLAVQEPRKLYDGEGNNLGLVGYSRQEGAYDNQRRAPERPRRPEDMPSKGLPRLPFEAIAHHEDQDSTFRPASSIYSQPSPNPTHTRFHPNQYQTPFTEQVEDVSPESSPELYSVNNWSQSPGYENVSPIDEMPHVSHLNLGRPDSSSNSPSSNIPVLRREKSNTVAVVAANLVSRKKPSENPRGRVAHDPRWDPYSGEITTSDRGKPQSVKPGTFTIPGLRSVHKETGLPLGNESSITSPGAKQHTSFSDRVRRLKSTTSGAPVEKPGWKGATGRVTLVSPVHDQLDMPPISLPRKSSKQTASPDSESFSSGGEVSPATIVRTRSGETSPASASHASPSIQAVLDTGSMNQAANSNFPRNDNTRSPITVREDPVAVSQSAAAGTLVRNANNGASPSGPQESGGWERDEGTMANIERNFHEQLNSVSSPIAEESEPEYVQPTSRFSVTTYEPSTANNTPRPSTETSDSHPMPFNSHPTQSPADSSFLLNRQRPRVPDSPRTNSIVSRKAVPALSNPVFISMTSVPAHIPADKRSSNIAKNLPLSPAEASSRDLVTSLEAQLENLAHRRINITRSIRQMTELMPKDSVMETQEVRKKREMEKERVKGLREEEQEIRREEHRLGLKLHRAWKRADKDSVFEPTGLWVRRVTG